MSSNEDLTKNHHEKGETKNQEFLRQRQLTCCCSQKVIWKASSQFHPPPPPPLPLFPPVPAVLPSSLAPSATILLFCFQKRVWKWSGPSFSVLTKQKAILFRGRNLFYADTASDMTSQRGPASARAKTGHGVSRLWVCHEWDEWGEALLGLPSWFGSCIYTLVTWAVAGPGTITRPALLEYHGMCPLWVRTLPRRPCCHPWLRLPAPCGTARQGIGPLGKGGADEVEMWYPLLPDISYPTAPLDTL